jgi:hypothetical protein
MVRGSKDDDDDDDGGGPEHRKRMRDSCDSDMPTDFDEFAIRSLVRKLDSATAAKRAALRAKLYTDCALMAKQSVVCRTKYIATVISTPGEHDTHVEVRWDSGRIEDLEIDPELMER